MFPFPNFEGGPGRPVPNYVNCYSMDDRFPAYLLCEYPVEADHYEESKEEDWFRASLKQIRRSGPKKFPPLAWIAVAIRNVAEHKDASTFEQSFKVAAIFKASGVFDSSQNLAGLVSHTSKDRRPFQFDPTRPSPMEQQRWLIVERHAATNRTAEGPGHP
jgi:hypothetical protein